MREAISNTYVKENCKSVELYSTNKDEFIGLRVTANSDYVIRNSIGEDPETGEPIYSYTDSITVSKQMIEDVFPSISAISVGDIPQPTPVEEDVDSDTALDELLEATAQ